MATTMVGQQSVMTQHFRREVHQSHSKVTELKSPEGSLGDVEADFQSLVNEMVLDGNRRAQKSADAFSQISQSSSSFSTSSSTTTSASPIKKEGITPRFSSASRKIQPSSSVANESSVFMAMPARVIPEPEPQASESEVVVERQMRVKDRIKRLEKQLSQEGTESPQPTEVLPRGRTGSIRSLADQFENTGETANYDHPRITTPTNMSEELAEARSVKQIASTFSNQTDETLSSKKVEGEFRNVKEVASVFQDGSSSIKPPAPFSDSYAVPGSPAVVRKAPFKPPAPPPEPVAIIKAQDHPPLPWKKETQNLDLRRKEFEETLSDMTKYSETLSQTSTDSRSTSAETVVQQPIHYSAQVKCEVISRVTTPDIAEQQQQNEMNLNTRTRQYQSEISSSTASSKTSSSTSAFKDSTKSNFSASAPTPLARTTAKPPRSESLDNAMPNFSLLRSASTGSVGSELQSGMHRARSDKDLPKFNIKKVKPSTTFGAKVWSPGGKANEIDGPTRIETSDLPSFKDVPPVWTPARAGSASPSLGRKEYRKLSFDKAPLPKRPSQENVNAPRPEESFAWKNKETENMRLLTGSSSSTLPRIQSPTVTLLQKKREGQIPGQRPDYIQPDESYYKPGDKLYTIKREYESEDDECGSRKFAVLSPKKFEGVGPTTRDGVPIALKSGVKSEHQGEWYKRMFDSLHKVKDDSLRPKFGQNKARYGGYMSEPDGYDSDFGSSRYATLDRRHNKFEFDITDSGPRAQQLQYGDYDWNTKRYVHQPGRIENYVPGFSSLSEKELRDNPEADVKLEIKTKEPPYPAPTNHRFGSGRMQMTHALKESGYESDSTLVFRKREDQRRQLTDPRNSSQLYKQIQLGGEIPISGLQRPAPPRPKDTPYKYNTSEVNIHYRTPIRFEQKESLSEEELARRQEEHMKRVYEQERRKKYLSELEDIERRRHTDNFTPLQKSPIPLNRYDDDSFGVIRGGRTPEPKQVARALFNFTAQNKRELSFNKGDIVTIRRSIDRNWYEGEMRGIVGILPCNYVEVVPFESLKSLGRKPTEGQARTRFNFQAQTAMEMSLTKGEMVVLTRRVDENWYEGRIGNRKGIFPVTYVDALLEPGGDRAISPSRDPIPRPALPAAHLLYNGTSGVSSPFSTMGRPGSQNENKPPFTQLTVNTQQEPIPYRALYNYKPQNEDELELLEGDTVLVMEKCDDGWFVGTSRRTGLFGTFPGNYVERS